VRMEIERIKQIKARIQGIIDRELCMEEDQEHWKSHHIADHIFHKLYEDGELLDDKKDDVTVRITEADWKRLNFDLLISSTYNTMRSMIVRWMKSLSIEKGRRIDIYISDVSELASHICLDTYYDRRNMIIIWLKRYGIAVYGRREAGNKGRYDKMVDKMKGIWKRQIGTRFMNKDRAKHGRDEDKEMKAVKEIMKMDIKIDRGTGCTYKGLICPYFIKDFPCKVCDYSTLNKED